MYLVGLGGWLIAIGCTVMVYAYKRLLHMRVLINAQGKHLAGERHDAHIKLNEELIARRTEFERELKKERIHVDRAHEKLIQRTKDLEQREQGYEERVRALHMKEREIHRLHDITHTYEMRVKAVHADLVKKLEQISGVSSESAHKTLLETIEQDVRHTSQKWIVKIEETAREQAKQRAISIVVGAMQRYAAEQVPLHASGIIHLPSEDMKGRIIGKDGRNIKALELATGMEFIIDESPEIITISGFNPIRREIARRAITQLMADGRINPTRIEETVNQCTKEIDAIVQEQGSLAILEYNLQGVDPEIVTLLGKLHFRTSYTQNVLVHSKEVAYFAQNIAQELGLDGTLAARAGLLHDIGKAVTSEVEGPHALVGADIAQRCGEHPMIVNAIAAHHEEVPFTSVYGPLIIIADTISAARPGARRETMTAYVQRMEKLEEIAISFEGVKRAYALQAGREVRIIVHEDRLNDDHAVMLARDIARMIEQQMNFPGQIKVNVIREKRAIEYAR